MTRSRTHAVIAAVAAAVVAGLALAASPAWADPAGRIQDVASEPGVVTFVLAAEGLAEGESIDPASVRSTIDGIAAPTEATEIAEAPVDRTAMLVMDSSGSMAEFDRLQIAQDSAKAYLSEVPDDVEVGLITFADKAVVKVQPTTDRGKLVKAIDDLEASGSTALNDAVLLATKTLGTEGSRNALLLSDGEDEGSKASAKQARAALADSGVVLDAVSLGKGGQRKQLAAFAKAGNGSVVTATNAAELTEAFESAARTVASQLTVRADVPAGIQEGTAELAVSAIAGGQRITDRAAVLISPAGAAPSASADPYGPIALGQSSPGLLNRTWVAVVAIVALFVGLLGVLAFAVGAVDASSSKSGRIARRLEEVSLDGAQIAPAAPVSQGSSILGTSAATKGLVSLAERVSRGRDTSEITRKLEDAHLALRPSEWVVLHSLIVIAATLVAMLLSGFNLVATFVVLVLAAVLPWGYLGLLADRRRRAFYDAIPDGMQLLAGSLASGYSLPQGLSLLAKEAPGPLGEEINRALLESRLGLPLTDTLEAVAQRMESRDFHWVVLSIRTHSQIGGNLAEVLNNVARTLRERERLRRQVRSVSAEGRLSTWIVAIMPIFLIVFFAIFRRDYLDVLLTRPIGWLFLGVGAILYTIGILWVRRLVNTEV